jgi:hypothetical protein
MRPPAKDAVRKCEWRRFFRPFAKRTAIRMPVSEKMNMKDEKERASPYRLRWTRHKKLWGVEAGRVSDERLKHMIPGLFTNGGENDEGR